VQETVFDCSCFQPFIYHPSDDAVRDSLVEERSKVRAWDRIEKYLRMSISITQYRRLGPEHVLQRVEEDE
jgi:hypothetical protein